MNTEATTTQTAAVAAQDAQVAPEKATSKKGATHKKGAPKSQKTVKAAAKAPKPKRAAKPKGEKTNKKAAVISMMQAKGGATLDAIVKATGWQKHTIRGLISILGSKDGLKIDSTKREDGARVYSLAK